MDYKEKYDGALEIIKGNLEALNEISETGAEVVNIQSIKNCFYRAFPELKESEDEKIRKALVDYFDNANKADENPLQSYGIHTDKVISWLEKQGEQKVPVNDFKAKDWYYSKVDGKIHNIYHSVDKVESKFKVGDWIVTNYGKVNQVVSVDKYGDGYTLDDGVYFSGSWCDMYHLWTIQDAKDGDILVCNNNPFLFSKYEKDEYGLVCCSYCGIADSDYGEFLINTNTKKYWCDTEFVYPATKEQHDLLFQKMKEAGYEWDAEKKELKKINSYCQEHCKGYQETGKCYADGGCEAKKNAETGWSEEDKKMLRCIGNAITADDASTYLESKDIQVIDAHVWLDELKDRVQPKQDWSEDDKRIFGEIILRCEKYGNQEQIDWLKSLKERYTWSPSDEQMEAVKSAALDIAKFSSRSEQLRLENEPYYKALVSLYRDLQKLRE